jgi:hypothetical protein
MNKRIRIITITFISFALISCMSTPASFSTEIPFMPLTSIASPAETIIPTYTQAIMEPVWTVTPSSLSLPTETTFQRPFLISYTFYRDGGDELTGCIQGVTQPQFRLYEDGELIVLKDGYKHTVLSRNEITELMDRITGTGLFNHSTDEYSEGWEELIIEGKRYYLKYGALHSDPLWQVFDIVTNYQPKNLSRYIPESLFLGVYQTNWEYINNSFFQSTPVVEQNWIDSPLFKFGEGWQIIKGGDVPLVMENFDNFPDFRIFQQNRKYYVASICANFPDY